MFDATWKTRNSSFLNWDIDKFVVQYEPHHSLSNVSEKDFALYIEQLDKSKLFQILEFFSFSIYILSANPQSTATIFLIFATRRSFQRDVKSLGHLLYNL